MKKHFRSLVSGLARYLAHREVVGLVNIGYFHAAREVALRHGFIFTAEALRRRLVG